MLYNRMLINYPYLFDDPILIIHIEDLENCTASYSAQPRVSIGVHSQCIGWTVECALRSRHRDSNQLTYLFKANNAIIRRK